MNLPARRSLAVALAAVVIGLGACAGAQPDPPAGELRLALTTTPTDVACVQLDLKDGVRSRTRRFDTTPGAAVTNSWSGLPTGAVQVAALAYAIPCASVGSTATPTWVSAPLNTVLVASAPTTLTLLMVRPGQIDLSATTSLDAGPPVGDAAADGGAREDSAGDAPSGPDVGIDPADPGLPGPTSVAMMVPTSGGEVALAGLRLQIPGGALSEPLPITAEVIEAPAEDIDGVSKFYEFGPHGTTFDQPLTVVIELTTPVPPGESIVVHWGYEDVQAQVQGNKVIAHGRHFSQIGVKLANKNATCASVKPNCGKSCDCIANGAPLFLTAESPTAGGFVAHEEGRPCSGYTYSGEGPVNGTTGACMFNPNPPFVCELKFLEAQHGEAFAHVKDYLAENPSAAYQVLKRDGSDDRRASALGRFHDENPGYQSQPGIDLDEFPMAMFAAGGVTSSVRPINASQNRSAGSCIGWQARGLPDGYEVKITLVPK